MFNLALYFVLATMILVGMTAMILSIGKEMAQCPIAGVTAKAASKIVAVGYFAIGLGGVVLAGLAIPLADQRPDLGILIGLGITALCLGLGFTQAMASLRETVDRARLLLKAEEGKAA